MARYAEIAEKVRKKKLRRSIDDALRGTTLAGTPAARVVLIIQHGLSDYIGGGAKVGLESRETPSSPGYGQPGSDMHHRIKIKDGAAVSATLVLTVDEERLSLAIDVARSDDPAKWTVTWGSGAVGASVTVNPDNTEVVEALYESLSNFMLKSV